MGRVNRFLRGRRIVLVFEGRFDNDRRGKVVGRFLVKSDGLLKMERQIPSFGVVVRRIGLALFGTEGGMVRRVERPTFSEC